MKILALDPSINNTGWCTFEPVRDRRKAWHWGTWLPEGESLEKRIIDLCHNILNDIGEFDYLIVEKPAFYSSERGMIAARQNYTIDLAAINYYIGGFFRMDHRHFFPVTAIQWKGAVSKDVTMRKFHRTFGQPKKQGDISEHSIDATMLMHWWLSTYAIESHLIAKCISPELLRGLL